MEAPNSLIKFLEAQTQDYLKALMEIQLNFTATACSNFFQWTDMV